MGIMILLGMLKSKVDSKDHITKKTGYQFIVLSVVLYLVSYAIYHLSFRVN